MTVAHLLDQAQHLHQAGALTDARRAYRNILLSSPGQIEAIRGLAGVLGDLHDVSSLISHLQRGLMSHPNDPVLLTQLGLAYIEEGKQDHGRACFYIAMKKQPSFTPSYLHAADLECNMGLLQESKETAQLGLLTDFRCADLHLVLGRVARLEQDQERAAVHWRRALRFEPHCMDALQFLAALALENGALQDAWTLAEEMDAVEEGSSIANVIRGTIQLERQEYAAAEQSFRNAVARDDEQAAVWHQLGVACFALDRISEAALSFERATALDPELAMAWCNLGRTLEVQGRYVEAFSMFERAFELRPDRLNALAGLIQCKRNVCDWSGLAALESRLLASIKQLPADASASVPLLLYTLLSDNGAEHLRLAGKEALASAGLPTAGYELSPSAPLTDRPQRLKIGYLTYDCRDHPMAHLMVNVLECHHRPDVEVWCYSVGPNDNSHWRARMERAPDHFVDAQGWTDADLAHRIHADGVHILVDLMGHTRGDRMTVFSRRPAPIQVSWLGYPGTSGAQFMDYLVADPIVAPPESQGDFTEALAYLPTYQPNDSTLGVPETMSRAEAGLPGEGLVLACFCRADKLDPVMFACWIRIMKRLPDAHLWVYAPDQTVRTNLTAAVERMGGNSSRVVFAGRRQKEDHLHRLTAADLILDTRLYNGHTTTSDALLAGVPVVTLCGQHFASRVSASLLSAQGLQSCIVKSLQEYEDLVVRLGTDPVELDHLKRKTRASRNTGGLFQTSRFVRGLENLFWQMVDRQVRGDLPRPMMSSSIPAEP